MEPRVTRHSSTHGIAAAQAEAATIVPSVESSTTRGRGRGQGVSRGRVRSRGRGRGRGRVRGRQELHASEPDLNSEEDSSELRKEAEDDNDNDATKTDREVKKAGDLVNEQENDQKLGVEFEHKPEHAVNVDGSTRCLDADSIQSDGEGMQIQIESTQEPSAPLFDRDQNQNEGLNQIQDQDMIQDQDSQIGSTLNKHVLEVEALEGTLFQRRDLLPQDVEPEYSHDEDAQHINREGLAIAATPGQEQELGFCFDEDLYNEISVGGTGRMAEMFRKMKQDLEKSEKKKQKAEEKTKDMIRIRENLNEKEERVVGGRKERTEEHDAESMDNSSDSDTDSDSDAESDADSDDESDKSDSSSESDEEDVEMEEHLVDCKDQGSDTEHDDEQDELDKTQGNKRNALEMNLDRKDMNQVLPRKRRRVASNPSTLPDHRSRTEIPFNNSVLDSTHSKVAFSTTPATALDSLMESSSGLSTVITSTRKFDINDLVASVASYGPEIASAFQNAQVNPSNKPAATSEQSEQPQLQQLNPVTAHFQHPCVHSHDHRSTLSRDEHHRYLMYDRIARNQDKAPNLPQLGPEDRSLWASLQEKVDQERQIVRQWNAGVVRSRITNYYNPAIREALET
ncbi:hypothetical protein BGZ65_004075, partial [Modicella reniformis]